MKQYAIVVDDSNSLRFINLETFIADYTLNTGYDAIDIVIAKDNKKAYVTAFDPHYLLEIDLDSNPPVLVRATPLPNYAEDISLSPNEEYALVADGGDDSTDLMGINLNSEVINELQIGPQAVSVPTDSRVFVANYFQDRIRLISMAKDGLLTKTQQESLVTKPVNIGITSDGSFMFAVSIDERTIRVLDISDERFFGVASEVIPKGSPQSLAVNRSNDTVYVLEDNYVEIFNFNPVSKRLTLINTIDHGMPVTKFYGVDQIALSPDESLLVFLTNTVNCYTVDGDFVAQLPITPYGGIATYRGEEINRPYDLLVTSGSNLVMVDSRTMEEKGRINLETTLDSIAVTSDYATAVVTTLFGYKIFQLDLTKSLPYLTNTTNTPTPVFSLAITPDNAYAAICGDTVGSPKLYSYSLKTQGLKDVDVRSDCVAVNPKRGEQVYIGQFISNRVKMFLMQNNGELVYSNQESETDVRPSFLAFHPSGNYLFVGYGEYDGYCGIDVLDTSSPDYFGITSKITGADFAFTILVNKAGDTVYVLATHTMLKYSFDTVSERLTYVSSFEHNISMAVGFGTPNMIFNEDETELLILSPDKLLKYSLTGEKLGELELRLPRSLVLIP